MRLGRIALLILAAALCAGPPCAAQTTGAPSPLRLDLGYEGRLLFKVLDVEVREEASSDGFTAQSLLTSTGILALLKHIHQHASSQGRIVDGKPEPGVFESQNLAGNTRRHSRTVWSPTGVSMSAQPAFASLGDPPASPAQKLAAIDPLTGLVRMTLAGSRDTTCNRSYLFFDGKQLYALDFGPAEDIAPSARQASLGLVATFRCDVRFREVAGFNKKPPEQRNQGLQRPIHIDFARAGEGGPLLMDGLHAETPLGWASIELNRLSLNGRPVAPTTANAHASVRAAE